MAKGKKDRKDKKEVLRPRFQIHIDIQCGVCRSLIHHPEGEEFPKFCWSCGATLIRFCIKCRKTVPMFFEEWWSSENDCHRTYGPVRRCPWCRSFLSEDSFEENWESD